MSTYRVQIIDAKGQVVRAWPAGDPIERDLAESIVLGALARGVGVFRTREQVATAIRAAVASTLLALKQDVRHGR